MNGRTTWLTVRIEAPTAPELNQIYEGEIPLADAQQYALKQIMGDGKAEVVVGLDMTAKDYGQGGGVFVSVKLVCDQDADMITYATQVAAFIARKNLTEQYEIHKTLLQQQGLVR